MVRIDKEENDKAEKDAEEKRVREIEEKLLEISVPVEDKKVEENGGEKVNEAEEDRIQVEKNVEKEEERIAVPA